MLNCLSWHPCVVAETSVSCLPHAGAADDGIVSVGPIYKSLFTEKTVAAQKHSSTSINVDELGRVASAIIPAAASY